MKTFITLHNLCLAGTLFVTSAALAQASSLPTPPQPMPPDLQPVHEEIEHQLAWAQEQLQLAQNPYGTGGFGSASSGGAPTLPALPPMSLLGGSPNTPEVLLLCSTDVETDTQREIREDLAIMTRVLERALKDQLAAGTSRAMGLELVFLPGPSSTKTTYLEDYGAIFHLRVAFPLLPAPEREAAPKPDTQPENTEWEAARRDVYGDPTSAQRFDPFAKQALRLDRARQPAEPYSEERVEEVRDNLFNALSQAGQIRHLKPTDYLLVTVEGAASASAGPAKDVHVESRVVTRGTGSADNVMVWSGPGRQDESSTLMTLRVKMADARDFAAGKISLNEFRGRAEVKVYAERLDSAD